MATPVPPVPGMLCPPDRFLRSYGERFPDYDPDRIEQALVDATSHIEDRAGRRLAPFNHTRYNARLFGQDPVEYGDDTQMPMDLYGSLGMSYAAALGSSRLIRHFWLDEFAPVMPELWTYSVESINVQTTYGNVVPINLVNGGLIGESPDPTDGHCWFRIGTFAPEGSRVEVVYSGGYTVQIPPSLSRACMLQAAKLLILEATPEMRSGMDTNELDVQTTFLIAPWIRG